MKVKLVFFVLFISILFGQGIDSTIVLETENFSSWIPAGWEVYDYGGSAPANQWFSLTVAGDSSAAIIYSGSRADDWLISPNIGSIAGACDSIILSYWHDFSHWTGEVGSSFVLISHDDAISWEETVVVYPTATPAENQLGDTTVHIESAGPFTGNERLAFRYSHGNGDHWYIDDVRIVKYMSEPVPPVIDHSPFYYPGMPYFYTSYPETVDIYDMTGVDSVTICYDIDYSDSFVCDAMTYIGGDPDALGLWTGHIPAQPQWTNIRYFFYAFDSFSPTSADTSDTFSLVVQGKYYAFDNVDSDPERPDTGWVDITTMGAYTVDDEWLAMTADTAIALPFTFRFYGVDYHTVYVHMCGILRFGDKGSPFDAEENQYFPDPDTTGPNGVIAGLWAELVASESIGGDIWVYDSDDDTFIVLYDSVAWNYPTGGILDNVLTMEIILISPDICSEPGGNSEIIIRYKKLNDDSVLCHSTVGVENESGTIGENYLYDCSYSSDAAGIESGRAIKFTTTAPLYFGDAGTIWGFADLRGTPAPGDSGLYIELVGSERITFSNDTGFYEFLGVIPGEYFVRARLPGYNYDASPSFNIAEGETIILDTLFVTPITAPNRYIEDFEDNGNPGETSDGWQWGVFSTSNFTYSTIPPLCNPPENAHSGSAMWGTILQAEYQNDAYYFLVFPTVPTMVKFWHYYDIEDGNDGGMILYSENFGESWNTANPVDGYDDYIDILSDSGFTGWSGDWVQDSIDLTSTEATHIGFLFASDSANTRSGWYLDDVFVVNLTHRYGQVEGYVYNPSDYTYISGATVIADGDWDESDATGFYGLDNVIAGAYEMWAGAPGFIPNYIDILMGNGNVLSRNIPLTPIDVSPPADVNYVWEFSYDVNETSVVIICNPTDDTINIFVDLINSTSKTVIPKTSSLSIVDSLNIHDVSMLSTILAVGCRGPVSLFDFWVTSIDSIYGNRFNFQFNSSGEYTGKHNSTFPYTGLSNLPGDIAYDGRSMWQTVPAVHTIYAWDPNSGDVIDSIVAPVGSGWDEPDVMIWGLAYDPAKDIFYLGDTLGKIWQIAGTGWATPGSTINVWQVYQPYMGNYETIYGLAFDYQRRTLWAYGAELWGILAEVDPEYQDGNIRIISQTDEFAEYKIYGMDISADRKLWGVFKDTLGDYNVYALGYLSDGNYPWGFAVYPHSLTLAEGECAEINLISGTNIPCGSMNLTLGIWAGTEDEIFSDAMEYPLKMVVSRALNQGWNLISTPVQAEPNDVYIQLSDNIYPFYNEPGHTNIYGWDPENGRYVVPDSFARGEGYFVKAWHNNTHFDISGAPYYSAFNMILPYYSSSLNPGWFLVGNPVNYTIDWDMIVNSPTFDGIAPIYYVLTPYGWASYSPGFPAGTGRFIPPYGGFFVVVLPGMMGNLPIGENSFLPVLARKNNTVSTGDDFTLRLTISTDEITDKWNYIGTRSDATDGFDYQYDAPVPPTRPETPKIAYLVNDDNSLMRDIRATIGMDEVKLWTLNIDGLEIGELVTISWQRNNIPNEFDCSQGIEQINEMYSLELNDPTADEHIDMRTTDHYTFTYTGIRNLNISVSATYLEAENNKIPEQFVIEKNIPNPFNANTEIRFGIPQDGNVCIEILDISGKLVNILTDDEYQSGWHSILWAGKDNNGDDVSTGIYFYRIRTECDVKVGRMILLR
mgnify:CR=1 FL=1